MTLTISLIRYLIQDLMSKQDCDIQKIEIHKVSVDSFFRNSPFIQLIHFTNCWDQKEELVVMSRNITAHSRSSETSVSQRFIFDAAQTRKRMDSRRSTSFTCDHWWIHIELPCIRKKSISNMTREMIASVEDILYVWKVRTSLLQLFFFNSVIFKKTKGFFSWQQDHLSSFVTAVQLWSWIVFKWQHWSECYLSILPGAHYWMTKSYQLLKLKKTVITNKVLFVYIY